MQALSQRIQLQQAQGVDVATVRLDPPQWGSVELRIQHDAGGVQVFIQASHAEVGRQLAGLAEGLRQELQARIDAAEPLMDFVYRSLQESSDITTPGGRAKALEDALTLIYPLRDSYMIDTYFIQIADLLGLDLETVRASSGRVFRDVAKREDAERRREQSYERQRAQAERAGSAGGRCVRRHSRRSADSTRIVTPAHLCQL